MSTNIPIPAVVDPRLREGALSVIRSLDYELEDAANDPTAFGELHDRLRGIRGLLDVIGWNDDDRHEVEVEIDLREHATALAAALDLIVPMLAEWIAEMADDHEDKPPRQYEYMLVRQFEGVARREIAKLEQGR